MKGSRESTCLPTSKSFFFTFSTEILICSQEMSHTRRASLHVKNKETGLVQLSGEKNTNGSHSTHKVEIICDGLVAYEVPCDP